MSDVLKWLLATSRQPQTRKSGRAGRRLRLGVEALEDRLAPALQGTLTWDMAPRIVPDSQGRFSVPNTFADVNPGSYQVNLHARSFQLDGQSASSYQFLIRNATGATYTARADAAGDASIGLPEGPYDVTLTGQFGQVTRSVTQPIVVRNLLVVSIGDSYASGEGNPEAPS